MPEPRRVSSRVWREVRQIATPLGPIEVALAGSGPAVLVIHGTPGSYRQCFSIAEDLRDDYLFVAPSRPGYGGTPLTTGRSFVEQARAYAAALDALGIERAAVIGASGGGPSAVAFATELPDRTAALVLCCALISTLIEIPAALRWIYAPRLVGETVSTLARAVNKRRLFNDTAVDRWLKRSLTPDELVRVEADPSLREALVSFALTHLEAPAGLIGIRNDLAQVRGSKARGPLAVGVSAPTLIMHGDADPVVPFSHAEEHHRLIPGAVVERYADAGHAFFFTRRAEVAARLRAFLDEALATEEAGR